jgi:hypothetical protein
MSNVAADSIAIIAKRVAPEKRNLQGSDAVEMIFDLEEKFDIQIPYNSNDLRPEFQTVGDVIAAISRLVAVKAPGRSYWSDNLRIPSFYAARSPSTSRWNSQPNSADYEHSDHQLRVDRGPADVTIEQRPLSREDHPAPASRLD